MYGLKPVPFKLKPVPFKLKPVPFKGGDTQDYFNKLLEPFSNSCALFGSVQGGFFSRKKPLIMVLSVYSNWRTAIVELVNGKDERIRGMLASICDVWQVYTGGLWTRSALRHGRERNAYKFDRLAVPGIGHQEAAIRSLNDGRIRILAGRILKRLEHA